MKPIKIAFLVALGIASAVTAGGPETPFTLEAAREQGRTKSRYLKDIKATGDTGDAIPKANVADFQKSVVSILILLYLSPFLPQGIVG